MPPRIAQFLHFLSKGSMTALGEGRPRPGSTIKSLPFGSFRIEDTYVITRTGSELVTRFDQQFIPRAFSWAENGRATAGGRR